MNEAHSTLSPSISISNQHDVPFAWCEIEHKTTISPITHTELNKLSSPKGKLNVILIGFNSTSLYWETTMCARPQNICTGGWGCLRFFLLL